MSFVLHQHNHSTAHQDSSMGYTYNFLHHISNIISISQHLTTTAFHIITHTHSFSLKYHAIQLHSHSPQTHISAPQFTSPEVHLLPHSLITTPHVITNMSYNLNPYYQSFKDTGTMKVGDSVTTKLTIVLPWP